MPVLPAVGQELIELNRLAGGMPQRDSAPYPLGTALNELFFGGGGIPPPPGSAQGDILYFDGVAWSNLVPGGAGTFLQSNGPGVTPTYVVVPGTGVVSDTFSCPVTVAVGDAVYISAANTVDKADAVAGVGQTAAAIGVVLSKPTPITAVVVMEGSVNVFAGLAPGTRYWLSPTTPGGITATPPSTAGQAYQAIGWAASGTKLVVDLGENILL